MILARLKHLLYAVFALATACALFEIGLRVYDSTTAQLTRKQLYDRGLTAKSWTTHHSPKPSQNFAVKNPDTERRVKVTFNSFGLRGPEPAVPKPPAVYRILCLGDESTLAPFIAESDTFCALLQEALSRDTRLQVEVLNGGVPEFCPLLAYLRYRHELLALQPDLVILTFDPSDVADDYQYRRRTAMSREGLPLSCPHPDLELPKARGSKIDEAFLLPEFVKSHARNWFVQQAFQDQPDEIGSPRSRYAWLKDSAPHWEVHVSQTFSSIGALSQLVNDTHGQFVLAVCPAPWQISATATDGPGVRETVGVDSGEQFKSHRPLEALEDYCRKEQIPFCDPTRGLTQDANPDRLYLRNAPSLSRDGHAVFAGELWRFLSDNGIGVPRSGPIRHAAFP